VLHLLDFDFVSLFACKLTEVAILTQTKGVVGFIFVFTVVGKLGSPVAVVARLAVSFGVERLVYVRTGRDFLGFSLFFFNYKRLPVLSGYAKGTMAVRCLRAAVIFIFFFRIVIAVFVLLALIMLFFLIVTRTWGINWAATACAFACKLTQNTTLILEFKFRHLAKDCYRLVI